MVNDLGLTPGQVANARTIITIGKARGLSQKDIETAVAVALAESNLQMYANSNVPESLRFPHVAVGRDHYSLGIFQQQTPIWGGVAELMNPVVNTNKFYDALERVGGRSSREPWLTAQEVQRSAFSDGSNYRAQWTKAQQIVAALTGKQPINARPVWGPNIPYIPPETLPELGEKGATITDALGQLNSIGQWFSNPENWKRIGVFALGALLVYVVLYRLVSQTQAYKAVTKAAVKVIA